jgi:hypothetical protein
MSNSGQAVVPTRPSSAEEEPIFCPLPARLSSPRFIANASHLTMELLDLSGVFNSTSTEFVAHDPRRTNLLCHTRKLPKPVIMSRHSPAATCRLVSAARAVWLGQGPHASIEMDPAPLAIAQCKGKRGPSQSRVCGPSSSRDASCQRGRLLLHRWPVSQFQHVS